MTPSVVPTQPQVLNAWMSRLMGLSASPWAILWAASAGIGAGAYAPNFMASFEVVGKVYISLLSMIVLPLLITSIVLSLQRAIRETNSAGFIRRMSLSFIGMSLVTSLLAGAAAGAAYSTLSLSDQQRIELGRLLSGKSGAEVSEVMFTPEEADGRADPGAVALVDLLIPSNIFAALSEGSAVKILIFSIMFGVAVASLPLRTAEPLNDAVDAIYRACHTLTRWVSYAIPLVIFCVAGSQLAKVGWSTFKVMGQFVGVLALASLVVSCVALIFIAWRAQRPVVQVLAALREALSLVLASANVAVCMPLMIEAMADRLGFSRNRVEFTVPLAMTLMRAGVIVYFVCGVLFIFQIEDQSVELLEVAAALLASTLVAFATGGMAGPVTVSMLGTVCLFMELPFEAIFVLLVAVDALGAIIRSIVNLLGICASVAAICPRPLRL